MADLRTILAQLLGQQEEPPNLNASAPSNRPDTRGIFGRRPTGLPLTGYADVAPMPPSWAAGIRPRERSIVQQEPMHPFPFPMGTPEPSPVQRAPMPTAARIGVPTPDSPGAYSNFADYANAQMALRTPPQAVDREPWRQNRNTGATETFSLPLGAAAPQRGLEPPSARPGPSQASIEDEAWRAARARVVATRGQQGRDPTGLRRAARQEEEEIRWRADPWFIAQREFRNSR